MLSPPKNNFGIYFHGDAYSTQQKIMGRQSAGESFIRGISRVFSSDSISAVGPTLGGGQQLAAQLQRDGFKGSVVWSQLPNTESIKKIGCLYYPAPCSKDIAHLRNKSGSNSFSLLGLTHTLSSNGAMDQLADLVLPPFKPWDALICTSQCAKELVFNLHNDMKDWWTSEVGPIKFNEIQLPVINLGINVDSFAFSPSEKLEARQELSLDALDVAFLFTGRLSFHAKANPIPMYQALEKVAKKQTIVCIEAGVFPNESIKESYQLAQKALAPSVRFIWVDGADKPSYQSAWKAADVFISLSDNIQETFGLTPVEAMAAGLPVVVGDWNGYKETVREGIDGFRIPTILPPKGIGNDLALRHALEVDTFDYYIGRASLATVVDPIELERAVERLVQNPELRQQMGAAGKERAQKVFDWPVILRQYSNLVEQLAEIRQSFESKNSASWPQRLDPFERFAHFSSSTLNGSSVVTSTPDAAVRLRDLLNLKMASYAFDKDLLPKENIVNLLTAAAKDQGLSVNALLTKAGMSTTVGVRCLMWLWKFDLIEVHAVN